MGWGQDRIQDYGYGYENYNSSSYQDEIRFGEGIDPSDISYVRDGSDLLLLHVNGQDSIRIERWFDNWYYHIEEVHFVNGEVWYDEALHNGARNIILVSGSTGDDAVILADITDTVLLAFDGNDGLEGLAGNDLLLGGNGDDSLNGNQGDDILSGGSGNDTFNDTQGNNIYVYTFDGSNDVIESIGNTRDRIHLSGDVSYDDLVLTMSGDNLVITSVNAEGSLTLLNWYLQPADSRINEVSAYGEPANEILQLVGGDVSRNRTLQLINGGAEDQQNFGWQVELGGLTQAANDGGAEGDYVFAGTGTDVVAYQRFDVEDYTHLSKFETNFYFNVRSRITWLAAQQGELADISRLGFRFYDAGMSLLAVSYSDAANDAQWQSYEFNEALPLNTAFVDVVIEMNLIEGATIDSFVDSIAAQLEFEPFETAYRGSYIRVGFDSSDNMNGDNNSELFKANQGDDTVNGGNGNDYIYGGEGNDVLSGNDGIDVLIGGKGDDYLYGRDSSTSSWNYNQDVYEFSKGDGFDKVFHYTYSDSYRGIIRFTDIDSVAEVSFVQVGTHLQIHYGTEGDVVEIQEFFNGNNSYYYYDIQWATGARELIRTLLANAHPTSYGTSGDDVINTTVGNWNNQIYGYEGNDEINSGNGNDQVFGNEGDDIINGGRGSDVIVGGTGNDQLAGELWSTSTWTYENDIYVFNIGDGQDKLFHYTHSSSYKGTIRLNDIADSSSISLVQHGQHLQVHYGNLGDYVEVQNFYSNSYYQYLDVEFSTTTKVSLVSLANELTVYTYGTALDDTLTTATGGWKDTVYGYEGNDTINSDSGNDRLFGNEGDDIINGGRGSDVIVGGPGNDQIAGELWSTSTWTYDNDIYEFNTGDGQDKLFHYTYTNSYRGLIRLNDIVDASEVSFIRNGAHLQMHYGELGDFIEVQSFYTNSYYRYLDVEFLDGTKTALETLLANSTAITYGTDLADTLTTGTGNWPDTVYGYAGDDVINTDGGNDLIYAALGNDSINAGAGNDFIEAGLGDDVINGGRGSDIIVGGPGNDQIAGELWSTSTWTYDNDIYEFNIGDGQDRLFHYTYTNSYRGTIRLNDIIDASGLVLVKNGQHLQVHYGDQEDYVEVQNFFANSYYQYMDVEFSDGVKAALLTLWNQQQSQT